METRSTTYFISVGYSPSTLISNIGANHEHISINLIIYVVTQPQAKNSWNNAQKSCYLCRINKSEKYRQPKIEVKNLKFQKPFTQFLLFL